MKFSDQTTEAKKELGALLAEQKALPGKIQAVLKRLSAERENELQQLYTRRDALPRLVDLAQIKVLTAEAADLEAEAQEIRQRRETGRPLIAAARKRLEEAQTDLVKLQRQYGGADAEASYCRVQLAKKRIELEGLIAQQTQERGAVVHSVWQMH